MRPPTAPETHPLLGVALRAREERPRRLHVEERLRRRPLHLPAVADPAGAWGCRQYACAEVRREVERDAYAYKGRLRVCSVAAPLAITSTLAEPCAVKAARLRQSETHV